MAIDDLPEETAPTLATLPKLPSSRYPGMLEYDLVQWLQAATPAFVRLGRAAFPPVIPGADLADPAYDLSWLRTIVQPDGSVRLPQGKQEEIIKCNMWFLAHHEPAINLVQQGGGKTFIAVATATPRVVAARAAGTHFRTVVICPGYLLRKWEREIHLIDPKAQVLIAKTVADLSPDQPRRDAGTSGKLAKRRSRSRSTAKWYEQRRLRNPHPLDADWILLDYTSISLTADTIPAAVRTPVVKRERRYLDDAYGFRYASTPRLVKDGPDGSASYCLSCPDCGAQLMDARGKYITPRTVADKQLRCTAPKTRRMRNDTGGLERTVWLADGTRETRRYTEEILRDKRGKPLRCNAPLWQYTANWLPAEIERQRKTTPGLPDQLPSDLGVREIVPPRPDLYRPYTLRRDMRFFGRTKEERGSGQLGPGKRALRDTRGNVPYSFSGPRKINLAWYLRRQFTHRPDPAGGRQVQKLRTRRDRATGETTRERETVTALARLGINYVIVDEVHLAKAKGSARGMAAGNIAALATDGLLALTGTLSGGYASTLFYLFWRFSQQIRAFFAYDDLARWKQEYGVRQDTWKEDTKPTEDKDKKKKRSNTTVSTKEMAGLSPAAYVYLWRNTIFAQLAEIFPNLPEYQDRVNFTRLSESTATTRWRVPQLGSDGLPARDAWGEMRYQELDVTMAEAYRYLLRAIEGRTQQLFSSKDTGGLGALTQPLLTWYNQPTEPVLITDTKTGQVLLDIPALRSDVIYPKEQALAEQIVADAELGLKSLVYVKNVNTPDVPKRLKWVLEQQLLASGRKLRVEVLRANTCEPEDREYLLESWVNPEGDEPPVDVVICNPELIQMGLDLIAFPRIHVYQMIYSPYVLSQAVRRSLRPGQRNRVIVRYWYYSGTLETGAGALMAKKAVAAAKLSGSDLGEQFMQQAGDMDIGTWLMEQVKSGYKAALIDQDALQAAFDAGTTAQNDANRQTYEEYIKSLGDAAAALPDALNALATTDLLRIGDAEEAGEAEEDGDENTPAAAADALADLFAQDTAGMSDLFKQLDTLVDTPDAPDAPAEPAEPAKPAEPETPAAPAAAAPVPEMPAVPEAPTPEAVVPEAPEEDLDDLGEITATDQLLAALASLPTGTVTVNTPARIEIIPDQPVLGDDDVFGYIPGTEADGPRTPAPVRAEDRYKTGSIQWLKARMQRLRSER